MAVFDKFTGIGVASPFKLQAKAPLDVRAVVETIEDRNALIVENGAYEGMKVYVKEDRTTYTLKGTTIDDWSADGGDVSADLSALEGRVDTIETNLDAQIEFTQDEKDKLAGIAAGANKTVVDSALNSTSTNPVQNKVINSALAGKVPTTRKVNNKALSADITLSAADVNAIPSTAKGAANGVAELDSTGKVPASQLPSYVDDVIEGYIYNGKFYKEETHTTEITGETGKIYVDLPTNKTYRWSGTAFVEISSSLALGETASTAYRGDRGKIAYDHSQSAHAPSNAERNIVVGIQKNGTDLAPDANRKVNVEVPTKVSQLSNDSGFTKVEKSTTNGNIKIGGTETIVYTHPTTSGNKHIPSGGTANKVLQYQADGAAQWGHTVQSDVPANAKFTDTTYTVATATKNGLMSAADKAKLDTMPTIIVSATAPTTSTPNSLWLRIDQA